MKNNKFLDNNFLEQSKWILNHHIGKEQFIKCSYVSECKYCVVYNVYHDAYPCSKENILKASKYYLRIEKLKKLKI